MKNAIAVEVEKPKRPLSAYNIYFKEERARLLNITPTRAEGKPRRSHGKIGFADMAKRIGAGWKSLDPEKKKYYETQAAADKERYMREMKVYRVQQNEEARRLISEGSSLPTEPFLISAINSAEIRPSSHNAAEMYRNNVAGTSWNFNSTDMYRENTSWKNQYTEMPAPSNFNSADMYQGNPMGASWNALRRANSTQMNSYSSMRPEPRRVSLMDPAVELAARYCQNKDAALHDTFPSIRATNEPQHTSQDSLEPKPVMVGQKPSVSELARKLDDESLNLFGTLFSCHFVRYL